MADIPIDDQLRYAHRRLGNDIHRFAGWLNRGVMSQGEIDADLNTQRAIIATLEREKRRMEPREFKAEQQNG